ncbi:sensor histidine kinase [Lentzea sp. NPDC058436]|uniref:sensor histidine kinase n=1 Tax=Lentzea sp. NPDC058436 TaxID=3346499 RepID=UPI00364E10C5
MRFSWPLPAGVRDTALAVAVAVLSFVPGVADKGTALGWQAAQRPFDVLAICLVLAHALPLAVRGRHPELTLAVTSAAFFLYQGLGYRPTFASISLYLALYSAGMLQNRFRAASVVLWCAGYATTAWGMIHAGSPFPAGDFLLFFALPAGCWLLGTVARGRLREQSLRSRERADDELREERERIARELHDVVTHHVTAMVMQADAAQYVDPADRARITNGLVAIGSTGRRALADLRELLNVLTPPHDARFATREPTISRLADLVEQTRAAGQPVELTEDDHGYETASGLVRLTVYRVVQEGLTNALKHAPGRRTSVRIHGGDGLVAEVTTEPGGPDRPAPAPPGRGLAGLERRVSLAGGELTAHRREDGAFVLRARLPLQADHR